MPYTERLSEQLAVVANFGPRVIRTAAQTLYTGVVDMRYHRRAIVIAKAKSYGTKMVKGLTVKLWDCDASGTAAGTAFLIGSTIALEGTQATAEPIAIYEVKAEDLGQEYGAALNVRGRYFKVSVTNSTNVRDQYSVTVLADTSRYGPGKNFDLASVSEIKTR
jgi:hypothetical protein